MFLKMKLLHLYLLTLISLTLARTSTAIYARPRCSDTCGNVRIPYPFGMGSDCYLNDWFSVNCTSSIPYLSAVNNLEILSVNLGNQTVKINVLMTSDCQNTVRNSSQILSVNLGGTPYLFSQEHNKFTVEGCGNAFIEKQGDLLTGCSSICENRTINQRNNCYGVNCCQTTIPYYLESYSVDVSGLNRQVSDGVCGSAFLVDEVLYSAGRSSMVANYSFVPISLRWTLVEEDVTGTTCPRMVREELDLGNGTLVESYKCSCSAVEEGSPYLDNGCQRMQSIPLYVFILYFTR